MEGIRPAIQPKSVIQLFDAFSQSSMSIKVKNPFFNGKEMTWINAIFTYYQEKDLEVGFISMIDRSISTVTSFRFES